MILGKLLPTSGKRAIWVAGGNGATVKLGYSYDGINWTASNIAGLGITNILAVASDGVMFVAGGQGTYNLSYSYDGINWFVSTSLQNENVFSIAWNGSYWLAATYFSSLYRSYDGVTWTYVAGVGFYLESLSWNGTRWLLGVSNGNPFTSTDGVNWSHTLSFTASGIACSAWTGSNWVAGSYSSYTIGASSDLNSWNSGFAPSGSVLGFAWNGSFGVAVGQKATASPYTSIFKYNSWSNYSNFSAIFSNQGKAVAWNGQMFVAVGQGTNTIAYSYDGVTWTAATNLFGLSWYPGNSVACNVAPNLYPPR